MRGARRARLRFEEWPQDDRERWRTAFRSGDVFDESGPGAHLAERTRDALRHHYECFLGFLADLDPRLLQRPSGDRPDPHVIEQLVTLRRPSCRETTIVSDLHKVRHALVLLCPERDWSWLLTIIKRIALKAKPLPARNNLVTSERLYALGEELMDRAVEAAASCAAPTRAQALQYRDGLLIALLALIPLRRRTVTAIRIGRQLVRAGRYWALDIPPEDTKTRRALDFPLSPDLSGRIDDYLARFRCRIPGAHKHDGLWASNQARSMDDGAIYDMVRRRTRSAFGFPINLHQFRKAAATFWALHDPANVRGVKDLLGHASFTTTDVHYIVEQSRHAGREIRNIIDGHRGSSDRRPRP